MRPNDLIYKVCEPTEAQVNENYTTDMSDDYEPFTAYIDGIENENIKLESKGKGGGGQPAMAPPPPPPPPPEAPPPPPQAPVISDQEPAAQEKKPSEESKITAQIAALAAQQAEKNKREQIGSVTDATDQTADNKEKTLIGQ